jgi:oxaloacetate decarboxylase alpha subunit/pyruvate carboxylase subunit B
VDSDILTYQVPGGMLSNFRNQLKEQGMTDKFDAVLKEIPIVREALGWIPLVTPTSQIVGTQAMMNVKFGRWKMVCQPAQDIALGKYGKTPGPIAPNVLAQVEKQSGKKATTERPADLLKPGMEGHRRQCAEKGLPTDDETVVLFAMFPQQVEALLKTKTAPPVKPLPAGAQPTPAPASAPSISARAPNGNARRMFVTVEGRRHEVTVESLDS